MAPTVNASKARCFLGIALPDAVRTALAAYADALRKKGLTGAWVQPANYHVTVRFLGDVSPAQLDHLHEVFSPLAQMCQAPLLALAGAGAFPDLRRPRVLWAGVEDWEGMLPPILQAAETSARAIGLDPETRPPHPHITLMRPRKPPAPPGLAPILEKTPAPLSDAFRARHVALWESTLKPGGAVYHQRKEYRLACWP